jgi:predicted HicB family RNase H-like nuclease
MSEDPTKFEHESHAALDRAEASLEQVERIMSGEAETARAQTAFATLTARIKEPLRRKLEAAAKRRGVSMNRELNIRIEDSFDAQSLEATLRKIIREEMDR